MLNRRAIALLGGIGAAGVLAKKAEADTAFTSFSYPAALPNGTGTTSGSQTSPVRQGVLANVKDFGAVGDGMNNDTSAIQAAINWTNSTSPYKRGTIFFPAGTYKVTAPLTFGSTSSGGDSGIGFLGVGNLSVITGSLASQFIFARSGASYNQSGVFTFEKLAINNTGLLGGGILIASGTIGVAIRDCTINADMGIACAEAINPTVVTNNSTSSGTTLHFAAVPQLVIDAFNNGQGGATTVTDVTSPSSISAATTVAGATATTITLSHAVAGTVGNGDTIQFTWTTPISASASFEVLIERVNAGAQNDWIPGSFGVAVVENSTIRNFETQTHEHAIRMSGDGIVVTGGRIETCRKAILLGMMPNGQLVSTSAFTIEGVGGESNGVFIETATGNSGGVIIGCAETTNPGAAPYTGAVPVSGVSVTGSVSGATGTAAVAYNNTDAQYEMTLTSVSGTFQVNDTVGDGTNIPKRSYIASFVSGSGGSGSVCAMRGTPEYGINIKQGGLGDALIAGCVMGGNINTASIAIGDGVTTDFGQGNLTVIGCSASASLSGAVAWITPATAGNANFIGCNVNQPEYGFNNLRAYPYAQFGDEFFVNNSSVSTFGGTVDGAGSSHVRALATKIVTGVTNATTAIGSPTIHFASTPAGIVNGMVIGDGAVTLTGVQPFPAGTIVTGQSGTTVTVSNNATAAVGNGDTIGFVQWTVSGA